MPALFDLKVIGSEELKRNMNRLEANIQKKYMRTALRTGAKLMKKTASSRVPVKTGALKRSFGVGAGKRKRGVLRVYVWTGNRTKLGIPSDAEYYYPAAIEYGSKKRNIRPGRYIQMAFKSKDAEVKKLIADTLWAKIRGGLKPSNDLTIADMST